MTICMQGDPRVLINKTNPLKNTLGAYICTGVSRPLPLFDVFLRQLRSESRSTRPRDALANRVVAPQARPSLMGLCCTIYTPYLNPGCSIKGLYALVSSRKLARLDRLHTRGEIGPCIIISRIPHVRPLHALKRTLHQLPRRYVASLNVTRIRLLYVA